MVSDLRRIVHSHAFDAAILVVVVANAIVLGLQTYPASPHGMETCSTS